MKARARLSYKNLNGDFEIFRAMAMIRMVMTMLPIAGDEDAEFTIKN